MKVFNIVHTAYEQTQCTTRSALPFVIRVTSLICDRLSMRKMTLSALDGANWFRFFVITSPALENNHSLATDVAGTLSNRHATLATWGYWDAFSDYQRRGYTSN